LFEHSEDITGVLMLVALSLLAASIATSVKGGLPDVALGWTFGLVILRAGVVFAVVAVIVMFLARGWGGLWPARISTTGVDYQQLGEASQELLRIRQDVRELKEETEARAKDGAR
jgi:hypothetical protein